MFFLSRMLDNKLRLPQPDQALPGRKRSIATASRHRIFKRPLKAALPDGFEQAIFGLGCFWAAERLFWRLPGVWMTAAGFSGGVTPNPTYQEVCTGLTGHAETVLVAYDPREISWERLLGHFWESHDPTQGMRQGGDIGTMYRSVLHAFTAAQLSAAMASRDAYQQALTAGGHDRITTEIGPAGAFFHAEAEHQQYLDKNPNSQCATRGTGIVFPALQASRGRDGVFPDGQDSA